MVCLGFEPIAGIRLNTDESNVRLNITIQLFHEEIERKYIVFFLKKWANPGHFFIYFRSFQTNITIFTTNQCEKMSCPSSIWRQDLNP